MKNSITPLETFERLQKIWWIQAATALPGATVLYTDETYKQYEESTRGLFTPRSYELWLANRNKNRNTEN